MKNPRLISPALFAALVACFFLPFVHVSMEREATATGFQLVTGDATFSGTYTHAAYEGEVEAAVDRGERPAVIGLVVALAGLALSLLRGRKAALFALATSAIAGIALFFVRPAVDSFVGPETEFRFGLTLALVFSLAAFVGGVMRVRYERRAADDAPVPFWDRIPKDDRIAANRSSGAPPPSRRD
jgi:hypothetical protein